MAEINVQRKDRKLWPWILGLAAVLVVLFVVLDRDDGQEGYAAGDIAPDGAMSDSAPRTWIESQRFILFVRDTQPDFGEINAAHEYTRNGLRYLASSLDEITRQDRTSAPNIQPRIAALREGAETIRDSASAPAHARTVTTVFQQGADAIAELQRARFPNASDAVSEVRAAAEQVTPDRALTQQRDAVKNFFDKAVKALRAMGAPEPQQR